MDGAERLITTLPCPPQHCIDWVEVLSAQIMFRPVQSEPIKDRQGLGN